MADFITKEEHHHSIGRIQEEVRKIADNQLVMNEDVKKVVRFGEDMHKLMYGNGQDGVITKLTRLFERVSLHTKIITGVILASAGWFLTYSLQHIFGGK